MRTTTTRSALAAVALAVLLLGGACSDGDDATTTDVEDVTCPFDAEQLSDALGVTMGEVDEQTSGPMPVVCLFVEDGADVAQPSSTSVSVTTLPPNGPDLAGLYDSFEVDDEDSFRPLPELGDDAFVAFLPTSGAPGTDDVIYQSDVYLELAGQPLQITMLGASTTDERDQQVDAIVGLVEG